MKNSIATILLSLLSLTLFSQPVMNYDDEYELKKVLEAPNKTRHCPEGFMISNDKMIPLAIVLDNSMTFTVTEGIFNGEKKLLNEREISNKLKTMISAKSKMTSSTIAVNHYKPYLIAQFENSIYKSKETIIIPLQEENNYLKMQGKPVKKTTIGRKTTVIVYELIETKLNDYVGHLALLK